MSNFFLLEEADTGVFGVLGRRIEPVSALCRTNDVPLDALSTLSAILTSWRIYHKHKNSSFLPENCQLRLEWQFFTTEIPVQLLFILFLKMEEETSGLSYNTYFYNFTFLEIWEVLICFFSFENFVIHRQHDLKLKSLDKSSTLLRTFWQCR